MNKNTKENIREMREETKALVWQSIEEEEKKAKRKKQLLLAFLEGMNKI